MSGRQFVGCSGRYVNAISRLMYTSEMMQHSGLAQVSAAASPT